MKLLFSSSRHPKIPAGLSEIDGGSLLRVHRNCQIISSPHAQSWTPTSRASPVGKLFPFIERCEHSINCLADRGGVNGTPELNGKSEASIKGDSK